MSSNICVRAALFVPILIALQGSLLASGNWDGGGPNDFWTTGLNWSDDIAPANDGTAQIYFTGSTRTMPDMDLDWNVATVGHNSSGSAFTLRSTNGRSLTTGQISSEPVSLVGDARFTVNVPVIAQTAGLTLDGTLTVNGSIQTSSSAQIITLLGSSRVEGVVVAGPVTGPGSLLVRGQPNRLSGNSTLTGTTTIDPGASFAVESSGGALSSTSTINLLPAANFTIGDTATNTANPNRINDTSALDSYAAAFTLIGSDNAATTHEQAGAFNLLQGESTITLRNAVAGRQTEFVSASLNRSPGTTLLLRGDNLGQSGASTVRFLLGGAAPGAIGGGGTAGSTKISIVPWIVGDTASGSGSNLVTYGPNGFRPLNSLTEYTFSITSAISTDNVRLSSAQSVAGSKAINSLVLDSATTLNISAGQTLGLGSGAVLFTAGGTITGGTLDFGTREGIFRSGASTAQIASQIAGSGGITTSSSAGLNFSGANTYSGQTYVNGILTASNNSALGLGGAGNETVLTPNATVTFTGATTNVGESFLIPLDTAAQSNTARQASLNLNTPLALTSDITFTGTTGSSGLAGTLSLTAAAGSTLNGRITSQTTGLGAGQLFYIVPASGRSTFNSVVSDGSGQVVLKFGAPSNTQGGAVTVNSASTHSGGTAISLDTRVYFNNTTGSGSGLGGVSTDLGSTLGGTGTLDPANGGTVVISGGGFGGSFLAPGDPLLNGGVGTLTIGSLGSENSLVIIQNNNVQLQIGSVSDMVRIFGGLQFIQTGGGFGQPIRIQILDAGGATPGTYPLITYTTNFTGPFSAATLSTLPAGWTATLVNNVNGKSIDLQLTSVPEPASVTLFLLSGLVALGFWRRSRVGSPPSLRP